MTKNKEDGQQKGAATGTAGSRTMKGLGAMNLTDLLSQGNMVPGVADQQQTETSRACIIFRRFPLKISWTATIRHAKP